MTKPSKRKPQRERDNMDNFACEEDPPLTPEQARRELGFDLLPFNGGDQEGPDE